MHFSTKSTALVLALTTITTTALAASDAPKPTTVSLFLGGDNDTDAGSYDHVFASVVGVASQLTTYAIRIADCDLLATPIATATATATASSGSAESTDESECGVLPDVTITYGSTTIAHTTIATRTDEDNKGSVTTETMTGSLNCVIKPTTEAVCHVAYTLKVDNDPATTETSTMSITGGPTGLAYAVATVTAGIEKLGGGNNNGGSGNGGSGNGGGGKNAGERLVVGTGLMGLGAFALGMLLL